MNEAFKFFNWLFSAAMDYMNEVLKILTLLAIMPVFLTTNCQEKMVGPRANLEDLYEQYENGEIRECKYEGKTVFVARINGKDVGTQIYNQDGKQIGRCNYAWGGPVDPICGKPTECEVIYRCDDHISGEPPVDKYGFDTWP